jgi:iron complex transport system substrate-binding protein
MASLAALAWAILAAAAFAAASPEAGAAETPRRVVSIHLCADQLLLALADRDQIAAVSWHAGDAAQSYMASRATGLRETYGDAEDVIALHPDLVLAGAYSGRGAVALVRRLGIAVVDLALPRSFADIRRQVLAVAEALGHPERGRALVAEMDARLDWAAREAAALPPAVAVLYQPGGVTMGAGFLEDEILRRAGLVNLATRLGIVGQGSVALEALVAARPDLVAFGAEADAPPSLSTLLFDHPAIRRAAPGARRVLLSPKLWTCGAWFTAEAVERLVAARRAAAR